MRAKFRRNSQVKNRHLYFLKQKNAQSKGLLYRIIEFLMDRISTGHRSWNMSRIRNKDTKPEIIVRSILHGEGLRFTVNGPKNKKLLSNPTLSCQNTKPLFLFTAVSGMDVRTAKTSGFQNRSEWWREKLEGNVAETEKTS